MLGSVGRGGGGTTRFGSGGIPKVHVCGGADDEGQDMLGSPDRGGGGTTGFGSTISPGRGQPTKLGETGTGCVEIVFCEVGGGAINRGGTSDGGGGTFGRLRGGNTYGPSGTGKFGGTKPGGNV